MATRKRVFNFLSYPRFSLLILMLCGKIKKKFWRSVAANGLTADSKSAPRNFLVIFWFIICCFLRTWEKKRNFSTAGFGTDNENGKLFTFEEIFGCLFCLLSCLQITQASREMLEKKNLFVRGERERKYIFWKPFSIIFIHVVYFVGWTSRWYQVETYIIGRGSLLNYQILW